MLLEESTAQMQDETDLGGSALAGVAKDSRDARGTSRGPGLPCDTPAQFSCRSVSNVTMRPSRDDATYTDLAPGKCWWIEDTSPPSGRSIYGSFRPKPHVALYINTERLRGALCSVASQSTLVGGWYFQGRREPCGFGRPYAGK